MFDLAAAVIALAILTMLWVLNLIMGKHSYPSSVSFDWFEDEPSDWPSAKIAMHRLFRVTGQDRIRCKDGRILWVD
jgi:hypothetical protein